MNDFSELLPWDELSARVKMLIGKVERLESECLDLRVEVEGLRDFSYNSREQIDVCVNLQEEFLKTNKAVSLQNVAFQEQINTLKNEQAETKELVYCLEKQIDAIEKVVADMTATIPLPEMEIVAVAELVQDGNSSYWNSPS